MNPLIKFWKILNFNNLKKSDYETEEAWQSAMESIYEPIDTRFCLVCPDKELGWYLLEASGSEIIKVTSGGDLK